MSVRLRGTRCEKCRAPSSANRFVCTKCGGALAPADFGPGGRLWSWTIVRFPLPDREPPFALAYVDFDDGPRELCHVKVNGQELVGGARVRLVQLSSRGDPIVEVVSLAQDIEE